MTRGDGGAGRPSLIAAEVSAISAIEDPEKRLKRFHELNEDIRAHDPVVAQGRHEAAIEVIARHPEWRSKIRGIKDMLGVEYSTAGEIVNKRRRKKRKQES